MRAIIAGGPLDACSVIPAGGCNANQWQDWQGRPQPTVSGVARD